MPKAMYEIAYKIKMGITYFMIYSHLFMVTVVCKLHSLATTPQPVDGGQNAELPCAHPASAELYINLRSVVILHTVEKDRAIRLVVLIAATLGRVVEILIIGWTEVRTPADNVNVGRYELAIKVLLVVDAFAFYKARVEPQTFVNRKGWRGGMVILVRRKSIDIDHRLVRGGKILLAARRCTALDGADDASWKTSAFTLLAKMPVLGPSALWTGPTGHIGIA